MILAVTCAHYGADYIGAAVRSTEGFADKHLILYTPVSTYCPGVDPGQNPDSREDVMQAAIEAGGRRVEWVENRPIRALTAFELYPDAELVLELDADEVAHPRLLQSILNGWAAGDLTMARYRVPMVHHWRSFRHVCRDSQFPVRLYLPGRPDGDPQYLPSEWGFVHHFGYARRLRDMVYKVRTSLHRDEFRPNWFNDIFLAYPGRLTDLHPVCVDGFWNAEPLDPGELPRALRGHPYADLEVIE